MVNPTPFLILIIFLIFVFPNNTPTTTATSDDINNSTAGPASRSPRSATFEVVYKSNSNDHSGDENEPSMADILSSDQRRVDAIHAQSKNMTLPVTSGLPLIGINEYVVTIALGTPAKYVIFEIDTGSALSWTQCKPCDACHRQRGDMYKPSSSNTYSNISCDSPMCAKLGYPQNCSTSSCIFSFQYSDGSYVVGFMITDSLKLTPAADVFPSFVFGCAQNVSGSFGEEGGLLGLGRGTGGKSIVDQTSQIYNKYFSYCFPSNESFKGHLTFGKNSVNTKNVKFTPLIPHPKYYSVGILAISLGGRKLPISPLVFKAAGCIIDSGTSLTYLPPTAYRQLRASFKKAMNKFYRSVPTPYDVLDTCFDTNNNKSVTTPEISFYFDGNVKVGLDFSGILRRIINSTVVCLAFAANDNSTDLAVFGNNQQRTLEVVYDVGGERLGFIPKGCK